ncbi:Rhomboid-like protein 19 [Glycine max]|nr:Rhomboid-like protein 19 [Glycine max]
MEPTKSRRLQILDLVSMSTPPLSVSLSQCTRLFGASGFTRLCKGLSLVLISLHILLHLFPSAITCLALIPARTIPFAWNLITAGYVEQSVYGVVVSTIGLLFIGKLLEPVWGPREFLNYMPFSGFHGVIFGFLVGIKQIVPDQELPFLKIKVKWLPSIALLCSIATSFWSLEAASYLPTVIYGTYMSWIYLRYWQRKPETKLKGDPSEDFAFSTFFPEFLRPVIDPIASIFHRMLCGRLDASNDAQGYTLRGEPLPGSDPIEASRRRERGARALEERLATAPSAGELETDATEIV